MRVGSDGQGVRESVSFLDHDLVADAASGRVKVDAVFLGEFLDFSVFGQVLFGFVLDVVVQCKDGLLGVVNASGTDGLEPTQRRCLATKPGFAEKIRGSTLE